MRNIKIWYSLKRDKENIWREVIVSVSCYQCKRDMFNILRAAANNCLETLDKTVQRALLELAPATTTDWTDTVG